MATALSAVCLLASQGLFTSAQAELRQPASPGYRPKEASCPSKCLSSGSDPFGWPAYHNREQLAHCQQAMFLDFSLYDPVDDPDTNHRIYACSAFGGDWEDQAIAESADKRPATDTSVTYEIGWSSTSSGSEAVYRTLMKQMQSYVVNGHAPSNKTIMRYTQFDGVSAGLYIGHGLRGPDVAAAAIDALEFNSARFDGRRDALTMQLCGPESDLDHVFGFMALRNGSFGAIQEAFKAWSHAKCLDFPHSTSFNTTAPFTFPLMSSQPSKTPTIEAPRNRTLERKSNKSFRSRIVPRADECRTEEVVSGDSCYALSQRCGITPADFTKYNPDEDLCSSLRPGQHVCCSAGDLPDFKPKPNVDGSCATTQVNSGQTCASIAASNSLETQDIEDFNQNTWGWNGCSSLFSGSVICISSGSPPMPAPMDGAICGPQVPGTEEPEDKSTLAELNPCPLNACCDIWGQCGITAEFCTDTGTGAPGSAEPGTNGCISNCGTEIMQSAPPDEVRRVAYYEGYSFSRRCLYQDSLQIDGSKYTHLHFGFGAISQDYNVSVEGDMQSYEFDNFKFITGPKRILSFGGWGFSTSPETYDILRQGTNAVNRDMLATNIAKFISDNGLDGVDIDWEYPGVRGSRLPSNALKLTG